MARAIDGELLISIHAPRVGGDFSASRYLSIQSISIHAPRVGGDARMRPLEVAWMTISIHAPRVVGDYGR